MNVRGMHRFYKEFNKVKLLSRDKCVIVSFIEFLKIVSSPSIRSG